MSDVYEPRNPLRRKIANKLYAQANLSWEECFELAQKVSICDLPSFSDVSAQGAVNQILAGLKTEVSV